MSGRDGGPAFPWSMWDRDSIGEPVVREVYGGMSLRDYFAAAALTGMLANRWVSVVTFDKDMLAEVAYVTADAMLTARESEAS